MFLVSFPFSAQKKMAFLGLNQMFSAFMPRKDEHGCWDTNIAALPTPRYMGGAALSGKNHIMVVGGCDDKKGNAATHGYIYLQDENKWVKTNACMSRPERIGGMVATIHVTASGGERPLVVAVGGHVENKKHSEGLELYDSSLDSWVSKPLNKQSRNYKGFSAAIAGDNGTCYILGGHNGRFCERKLRICFLNHEESYWFDLECTLKEARFQCSAATISGTIYVCGGCNNDGEALASVEAFNTSTESCVSVAPMQTPRKGAAVVAVRGLVFVFGGHDGRGTLQSAEVYDPLTDKWEYLPSMKQARFAAAAAVVNNQVYVIGGFDNGKCLSSVERFTPCPRRVSAKIAGADTESVSVTSSLFNVVDADDAPDQLSCPITGVLMHDPVVAADGHSYEREALEQWFARFCSKSLPRSPVTNAVLKSRAIVPNHSLKSLCNDYGGAAARKRAMRAIE